MTIEWVPFKTQFFIMLSMVSHANSTNKENGRVPQNNNLKKIKNPFIFLAFVNNVICNILKIYE